MSTGVREVLLQLAADLREDVAKAIANDQDRRNWFRDKGLVRSERTKALYVRRGHGYSAVLAVADQIEARAEHYQDAS